MAKKDKEYAGLGLLDGLYEKALAKVEKRAAAPVDAAREQRESNSGIFYEVQGGLANAAAAPATAEAQAVLEQAQRFFEDAEGMLVMDTLDAPALRATSFAALAAIKRQAGQAPELSLGEARGAFERLPPEAVVDRARALLALARPGVASRDLDRLALKRADQLLASSYDCESAEIRAEMALLLHAAGDDSAATALFTAARKVLSASSPGAFAATLARVAAKEALSGFDAEPTFRKARMILDTAELDREDFFGVCADFVGARAEALQLEAARAELARLADSGEEAAAASLLRARGLMAAAMAKGGDVSAAQAELARIPRGPNRFTASAAIEALSVASRALAERGYSHAAQRVRDEAFLVLKALQEAGVNELTESAIMALAIALASCGSSADAQTFAGAAGARATEARAEVALATARAGLRLMQDARSRR
ncbi:MAG: hypothetical protein JNK60_08585 [Acidobacteria bacterium]|nr:hypothetical protein [Acidobacteriota bacterium]